MRAIIIDDKDSRALLDRLKLESFNKDPGGYGIEMHEAWRSLPESIRNELVDRMHRKFHYHVARWLTDQGATIV
jgi:hypothetical protein